MSLTEASLHLALLTLSVSSSGSLTRRGGHDGLSYCHMSTRDGWKSEKPALKQNRWLVQACVIIN
jgi:hypothetical protein